MRLWLAALAATALMAQEPRPRLSRFPPSRRFRARSISATRGAPASAAASTVIARWSTWDQARACSASI